MSEAIYHIGIVQAWFAAVLVTRKQQKGPADQVLIIWLVVIGFEMLYSLLNLKFFTAWPDLIVLPFAYGPLLLFYTRYLLVGQYSFRSVALLHFLPVVIFASIGIVWQEPLDITTIDFWKKGAVTIIGLTNFSLFLVSMLSYWIIVLRMVRRHNARITDLFSYESSHLRLNWLHLITVWIFGSFIVTAMVYAWFAAYTIWPFNPVVIYHIGLLFFIFSVSFFGIHQTILFPNAASSEEMNTTNDDKSEIGKALEAFMAEEKPYLDRELTIHALADRCGIEAGEISGFLNQHLKKNFFTYINEFRVEEAKRRIALEENNRLTLLAIGYDSGFNSKSSFNSLFKKYSGQTPSEYRKKNS